MKRSISMAVVVVFLLSCMVAGVGFDVKVAHARSMLLTDANNKVCPVTGEEIKVKKYSTGYDGKRYWFATYQAVLDFKKNPSKYIKGGSNKAAAPEKKRAW